MLGIDLNMHRMVRNTTLNNMFRVWSGLLEYSYQDDLVIRYKRTKKIIIATNKITLKKSLTYNKDEMNFIDRTPPTAGGTAT